MPPVIAIIFWLWFAVSMVLLVQRRIKAAGQKRRTTEATMTSLRTMNSTEVEATDEPSVPPPPNSPVLDPEASAEGSHDQDFPAVTMRTGDDAPSLRDLIDRPTVSVADILEGITMPCDLVPLTSTVGDEDLSTAKRVVFFTNGHPAPRVGSALADELARLGMEVESSDASGAVATNEAGCVELTIYANPETVQAGNGPAFPTAPNDSVVVEIKTR